MPSPFNHPIYVVKPMLPDLEQVIPELQQIWNTKLLTNNGVQCQKFETVLQNYFKEKYVSVFCNGTLALQLACQTLDLSGEVITTPFTSPATAHALHWNNIKPVFCDINPYTFNIDPKQIESLITPETTAILPVHIFGYPCDILNIKEIADRYDLKIIYDAAHAFGVEVDGQSISSFGDISMFSTHATKIFHTFEGGILVCRDSSMKQRADLSRNLGRDFEENVIIPGSNAKMNEFQATIGLLLIEMISDEIESRKRLSDIYRNCLKDIDGIFFREDLQDVKHNYSSFVICITKECHLNRDNLHKELKKYNVFTRKYFYPLLSQMQCYEHLSSSNLTTAEKITKEVLSFPLYGSLKEKDVYRICDIVRHILC